jgi:ribosomal protein S18 acetylase RimI-like enzyme
MSKKNMPENSEPGTGTETGFCTEPGLEDLGAMRRLLERTGVFNAEEVDVAESLIRERLERGIASEYHFLLDRRNAVLAGFICYGPIGCAPGRWDIYWVAVDPDFHGQGLGKALLHAGEQAIRAKGGERAYVETSSLDRYTPARALYRCCGYTVDAFQRDFYAMGDHKVTLVKILDGSTGTSSAPISNAPTSNTSEPDVSGPDICGPGISGPNAFGPGPNIP